MDAPEENNSPKNSFWKELGQLLLIAVIIVVPFRLYIAQPFIVDGLSMYPTFDNGHYLVIDEISYRFKDPERGSVLVFKYPKDPSKYFVKRIIGLPGETVKINGGVVTIVNDANPNGFTLEEAYVKHPKADETLTYNLEEKEYFVMGDNRASSADSRLWGPVPEQNMIGRPILRFYPPSLFPGDVSHYQNVENQEN